MLRFSLTITAALVMSACASGPRTNPQSQHGSYSVPQQSNLTLPDTAVYSQQDPRWSKDQMGGSGATLEAEGCLVTATAMALTNLGFKMSPGDLNHRLKQKKGYTSGGLLVWSGIDKVTGGGATARFYNQVNEEIIQSCMRDGFYPLARFILPSGRTHWAMILHKSQHGYHMRDPLHPSSQPLIFPAGISGFKAVRCVGRA